MWLTQYARMTKETFMSFEDFYRQITTPIVTTPTEEILAEVEEIRKAMKEGENNRNI